MNEKIKAIWNLAASNHTQEDTSWKTQQNFLNKFAELIIKECIDAVDNTNRHHAYTTFDKDLIDFTIAKSKTAIKERFGVQ